MHLFGNTVANSHVVFHCNNEAIVHDLNNETSKNPTIMSILRPLILIVMENNIVFLANHVPGKDNTLCDTPLSFPGGRQVPQVTWIGSAPNTYPNDPTTRLLETLTADLIQKGYANLTLLYYNAWWTKLQKFLKDHNLSQQLPIHSHHIAFFLVHSLHQEKRKEHCDLYYPW